MKRLSNYLRLMRPYQWVKNGFVFVPLIFSKNLLDIRLFSEALFTFAAFCLAASAVYVVNDIADRDFDKLHPLKRERPIASGDVSVSEGWGLSLLLLAASFIFLMLDGARVTIGLAIAGYIGINLFYSFRLKRIVLIDLFVIALGFILRILAGGYAIDVKVSSWLIMTTLFISIFLGVAKRRSEFVLVSRSADETTRKVLSDYDLSLIDQILSVSAASVIITYALYTVSERTVQAFHTEALIFTTVFVTYGIFRYLYLVHKMGLGENPAKALLTDKAMVINTVLYLVSVVAILYKQELIQLLSTHVPLP